MDESPNMMYGRLKEAVNISGYSLERAMHEFDWLLDNERWKKVGDGFEDINEFLKTISLSEFKIAAEQRKEIAKKLSELKASQRNSAKVLGVGVATINRDTNVSVPTGTEEEELYVDNKEDIKANVPNETELDKTPNWIDEDSQKIVSKQAKTEERKRATKERISEEKKKRTEEVGLIDLRIGDFKNVLSDVINIDTIITDPPYPNEFIQCFSELSLFASEHLKEDGFCIVYSGQYHLPEVIKRLSEHLTYVWTFCLYHVGKKQLVNGVNIMCGWKPVLIFSNGKKKMRFSAYDVLISEKMEKFGHEWQQSESGVANLVEIFSEPGQLIVDPFAGSGTFLKVANEMNRNTIGAEIND